MSNLWRRLDNNAKVFSVDNQKNDNTFRLSVILKEKVDPEILKSAVLKTLASHPSYRVKIRAGIFWNYLDTNRKKPIIEEEKEIPCKIIDFRKNNDYVFKVTYFNNKINVDIFHILTDGVGSKILFKEIVYNYLTLKYGLKKDKEELELVTSVQDQYLKNVEKRLVSKEKHKKAFLIDRESNLSSNKTYHYILNLSEFKSICKKASVSITEYLTALYIYAIYKSMYDISSNKDIIVLIPIDLRKHYNVESLSNFFTCMHIEGNVVNNKNISFDAILNQVRKEFHNKLTLDNIKKYMAQDVNLGMHMGIRLIPLFLKKMFMKYCGKLVTGASTTTLSNIGMIEIEERYKNYIDNIMVLVSPGTVQKVKCTVCSYENNLTVTINSNLISDSLENEFYELLKEHIGHVKIESNVI